jgi:hypothetical protein
MRDPSIHVRQSTLVSILKNILQAYTDLDSQLLALEITTACKHNSCTNRSIVVSNDKLARDADRMVSSGNIQTLRFQTYLNAVRRNVFKHRGLVAIKPGSKDWLPLKEVAANAEEFCKANALDFKAGYVIYCKIGLSKMVHYNLNKFPSLHQAILDAYEAELQIENDPSPQLTQQAHDLYCRMIAERVGIPVDFLSDPLNYSLFIQVVDRVFEVNTTIKDYITAQFNAFEWNGSYPQPPQLVNEKAKARFLTYAYKNNLNLKSHGKNRGK